MNSQVLQSGTRTPLDPDALKREQLKAFQGN